MIIMVLEKQPTSGGGDRLTFLNSGDVSKVGGKFICIGEPRDVDTQNFGTKLFVDLKPLEGQFEDGSEAKTWVANKTSRNFLIDSLGSDEAAWLSQPIELEVVQAVVNNAKKEVIYAVGAI